MEQFSYRSPVEELGLRIEKKKTSKKKPNPGGPKPVPEAYEVPGGTSDYPQRHKKPFVEPNEVPDVDRPNPEEALMMKEEGEEEGGESLIDLVEKEAYAEELGTKEKEIVEEKAAPISEPKEHVYEREPKEKRPRVSIVRRKIVSGNESHPIVNRFQDYHPVDKKSWSTKEIAAPDPREDNTWTAAPNAKPIEIRAMKKVMVQKHKGMTHQEQLREQRREGRNARPGQEAA